MNYLIIDITTLDTPDTGALSFFEGEKSVPFEIKRIYYIYGAPDGTQRGGHAHKHLQQLLFCPYGKILMKLDDGKEKKEILLDTPNKGLLLEAGIWRDMIWLADDSVLCVAASQYYSVDDYIRSYDDFLRYIHSIS